MKSVIKLLRCLHPVLWVSVTLAVVANRLLRNQGGPCPSPLILLFALISIGIGVGALLTIWRIFLLVIEKPSSNDTN